MNMKKAVFVILLLGALVWETAPIFRNFDSPPPAKAVYLTPLNNYRPKDHAIIRKDGVWHVFAIYTCIDQTPPCDTGLYGLMHLTSTDLKNWTEVGYVIPPGTSGAWDDYDIWAPSIVERDGTYYMFYTGVTDASKLIQKIGVATSTDLYTWTKSGSNPVVNCGDFSWAHYDTGTAYQAACRDPYVYWDQNQHQWVMFMSALSTDGSPTTNAPTIGIATSEDLLTWREYGHIATTDDYTAESPHVIEHGGTYYVVFTDNCSPQPCLKYVSSTNLYSGYGAQTSTGLEDNAYASEYYKDGDGREYFSRVDGTTNLNLDISQLTWTGSPFTVQEPAYGSIGDYVWNDTNADTAQDSGESGLDNVALTLYLDNGDGVFDAASDDVYATTTTGDDPNTIGTQHGYYTFSNVLPATYWVSVDPSNYAGGGALENMVPTTTASPLAVTISDSENDATIDLGFQTLGTSWSLNTPANFSLDSGLTLSNGRASPTSTSNWWNNDYRYRQQLTVTANTQTLDTTKTMILTTDLATLVSASKLQSSYNDLRLVYWDGSSNTEIPIDIINSTTVRFKVQASVTAGNTDSGYYLYFGDPNALPRSQQLADVYDYYDSFNAPDGTTYNSWEESGDTNWVISNNAFRYNATTVADRFARDTSKTVDLKNNWQLEATATINSGSIGGAGFFDVAALGTDPDHLYANFDAANDRTQFYHYDFGQVGSNTATTINTATAYRIGFGLRYLGVDSRFYASTLDGTTAGSAIESGTGYDIWYPGNNTTAHPALNTFNGNVTFDDLKGWEVHDGSVSAGSEAYIAPAVSASLQPTSASTFARLTAFGTDQIAQGGDVTYVLSNDGGTTWQYWDGSSWTSSNSTAAQSNSASTVNTNAASFAVGSGQFTWKAIFAASGDDQPTLLQVAATLNQAPNSPTISSPADGAELSVFKPVLKFSTTDSESNNLQYQVQIDTVNTFDSSGLITYTQASSQTGWSGQDASSGTQYTSGTTATLTVPTALSNGTYYWRVRAIDPSGSNVYSSYTSARSFDTPPALILSNINGLADSPTTAVVSWTSSNAGTSTVEYGRTAAYGTTAILSASTTSHSLSLPQLEPEATYFFRVSTTDSYGQTTSSANQTFVTPRKYSLRTPTLFDPSADSITLTSRPIFTGLAQSGNTIFILLDGSIEATVKTSSNDSGVGSFAYRTRRDLSPGVHAVQLIARDDATNGISRTTARRYFTTFPDSGPTILKPATGTTTNSQSVTVAGVAWRNHDVFIFVDGSIAQVVKATDDASGVGSFAAHLKLDNGVHRIHARTRGPDGSISPAGRGITVEVKDSVLVHVVTSGESLWSIAKDYFGQGSLYPRIIDANPTLLNNPILLIGQLLKIIF